MGRPSSYKPEYAKQAENICKLGATSVELAEFFEVSDRQIRRWINEHPAFGAAVKVGRDAADERVVAALYQRACGYEYQSKKVFCNAQGIVTEVPFTEHVPADTKAALQWLFNRRPDEWRMRVEHTGDKGGPIQLSFPGLTRDVFDAL